MLPLQTLIRRSLCSFKESMGVLCFPFTFGWVCSAPISPWDFWQHYSGHILAVGDIPNATYHHDYKHRLFFDLSCRYSYCLYWSCLAASCCENMPMSHCLRTKTTASEQRYEFLCSFGVVFSLLVFSPILLCSAKNPKGPSKCSVLLQRELQVANMKSMICKGLRK